MCLSKQALEEALNLHSPSTAQQPGMNLGDGAMNLRYQEALTQIAVLKEQVNTSPNLLLSFSKPSSIFIHLYGKSMQQAS